MTSHPREPRGFQRGIGRREFLERGALGVLGLTVAGPLLAACGGGADGGFTPPELDLARPESPVRHAIFPDNPRIASGLDPEAGPLKIYNWRGYLWPKIMKRFGKEYDVEVQLSTFSTMDEAVAKIASAAVDYDVFFPTPDRLSRLVLEKTVQPLNHHYLPNLQKTIWPSLRDPFYDKGSRYTVPYTIYTTGIGYRADKVETTPWDLDNPYDIYWDRANKGKLFMLDDGREALAHMLLKNGITEVNTDDREHLDLAKSELKSLRGAVDVKLSTDDYTNLPKGTAWVHQAWSGSLLAAQWYLPDGVKPKVLGYWFPPDGGGSIGNDVLAIPKTAKNPVLAHHFLNYLIDEKHGFDNFVNYNGYQPPFISLDPHGLVSAGIVPGNLRTAVVREKDFDAGYFQLELTPAGLKLWQDAWAEFKAGV
jgi:spermidine/putrescine transport system substrate-binding protein